MEGLLVEYVWLEDGMKEIRGEEVIARFDTPTSEELNAPSQISIREADKI